MIKKIKFVTLIIFCLPSILKAQTFYKWTEVGMAVGATHYFGDLNDNYGFKEPKLNLGVFFRYHWNHYIAFRFSANYTKVGYSDSYNSNVYQNTRNLNFQSQIFEGTAQAELNFFRYETGSQEFQFTPYITAGIGAFYYNPYTHYNGEKYFLRDLGTEGQRLGDQYASRKYSNFAICAPVGIGVKWWLLPGVNLGLEITDRLTTTDYLDDVSTNYVGADKFGSYPSVRNAAYFLQDPSLLKNPTQPIGIEGKQRGSSATKDQYLMVQFHLSIQFKTYKCPVTESYWRTQF
jgi:hypothetical protein